MWADQALERVLARYKPPRHVLDIGYGDGEHLRCFRAAGYQVTGVDWKDGADYNKTPMPHKYDVIWCSHVLEHQLNVNHFLEKCYEDLVDGGVLAITVPPLKHEIVGGHLTLWNQGLLLYNLILAGFDCRKARVSPVYDYNISVIVEQSPISEDVLAQLHYDAGDIEALAEYFPFPVHQGFDGSRVSWGW